MPYTKGKIVVNQQGNRKAYFSKATILTAIFLFYELYFLFQIMMTEKGIGVEEDGEEVAEEEEADAQADQ